jgi:hypothetical protein
VPCGSKFPTLLVGLIDAIMQQLIKQEAVNGCSNVEWVNQDRKNGVQNRAKPGSEYRFRLYRAFLLRLAGLKIEKFTTRMWSWTENQDSIYHVLRNMWLGVI